MLLPLYFFIVRSTYISRDSSLADGQL